MTNGLIITFYKFIKLKELRNLRIKLLNKLETLGIKGTILIAEEGINGMLSGKKDVIKIFQAYITEIEEFVDLEFKENHFNDKAFSRTLVKIKKEIITLRRDVDPTKETGKYITALEFKKRLDNPNKDFLILDTRNDYEVAMGSFKNAINPNIKSFEEFALYIDKNAKLFKDKEVITYCTGGIRCEKATAYMKQKGISKAYQLEGGIIKYFEKTKENTDSNHWHGECTVFDRRKAITSKLEASDKTICYVCLQEINGQNEDFEKNKNQKLCLNCYEKIEFHKKKRQKQGEIKAKLNYEKRKLTLEQYKKIKT